MAKDPALRRSNWRWVKRKVGQRPVYAHICTRSSSWSWVERKVGQRPVYAHTLLLLFQSYSHAYAHPIPQTDWAETPMMPTGVQVGRCFEIDTFKRQFCLYCDTDADAAAWLEKVSLFLEIKSTCVCLFEAGVCVCVHAHILCVASIDGTLFHLTSSFPPTPSSSPRPFSWRWPPSFHLFRQRSPRTKNPI